MYTHSKGVIEGKKRSPAGSHWAKVSHNSFWLALTVSGIHLQPSA